MEPGTSLIEGLRRRRAEADGHCVIDYGIHVNLREPSLERVAEIPAVMAEGVPTVKLFMSYETYRLPDDIIFRAMQRVAEGGGMAVVHAENGAIVAELSRELEQLGRMGPESYPAISPPAMEGEAAHRALALARLAGCRLLIFHLTTVDSLRELRRARDARPGRVRRGAAAPSAARRRALRDPELAPQFMGTPPLRSLEHRDALWRALADGTIDIVSTDHGPRRRVRGRGRPAATPGRDERGRGAAGADARPRGAAAAASTCTGGSSSAAPRRPGCTGCSGRAAWRRATTPTSCSSTRRAERRALGRASCTPTSTTRPTTGCTYAVGRS